jgi:tetratricopeptide (TPR) repeat protein
VTVSENLKSEIRNPKSEIRNSILGFRVSDFGFRTFLRRRTLVLGLALILLSAGITAVVWWRPRSKSLALPEPDLAGADPAVTAAIETAQAAVRRGPRSADAWGRLGMVLAAHAFYPESIPCFAEAERLDPGEPRWPYFRGVMLTLSDADAALIPLRRAVELCEPRDSAPGLRLAETLLGQGEDREAEDILREVLAREAENPRAHLRLGRLAYRRNDWEESLRHLGQAASSPLTRKAAHVLSAEVHQRRGDHAAADRQQRLAAELPADPEPPDTLVEEMDQFRVGQQAQLALAGRLLQQERAFESVALLQKLVRDYPGSASAWLGLGRALIQQESYRAAEQALRRAAELDAARVEVQFYLGVAAFQQGRTDEAAAFFRRAIELRPDYALAQYNLGHCLKAQADRPGAIAAFQAAVRYKPHHAQAHANLGELLAQEGRRDDALQHLRLAIELDPSDKSALALLKQLQR